MKVLLFLFFLIPCVLPAQDFSSAEWSVSLSQGGLYFSSERVTAAGFGGAAGIQSVWNKSIVVRADAGILWGNGNSVPVRIAIGIQRSGSWSPAIFGTLNLLWGDRIEILSEKGLRPAIPAWSAGILIAPLRFEEPFGCISALELGAGLGPDRGYCVELSILDVSVRWK